MPMFCSCKHTGIQKKQMRENCIIYYIKFFFVNNCKEWQMSWKLEPSVLFALNLNQLIYKSVSCIYTVGEFLLSQL